MVGNGGLLRQYVGIPDADTNSAYMEFICKRSGVFVLGSESVLSR